MVTDAGTSIVVGGSSVFGGKNVEERVANLLKEMK